MREAKKNYLIGIEISKTEDDKYFYDTMTIKNENGVILQEIKWINGIKPTIADNYNVILEQIEYAQNILDRCKEIITDKEINSLNKLFVRINTLNDITYDILGKIEDLKNKG